MVSLAARAGLCLLSGWLYARTGAQVAALTGGPATGLARWASAVLVCWVITGVGERLAGRSLREALLPLPSAGGQWLYVSAVIVVGCGATVLALVPPGRVAALLVAVSPQSFAGPQEVPPAAARLVTTQLGWGLTMIAALVAGVHRALSGRREPPSGAMLWFGLAVAYGGLVWWVGHIQSLTGDEPHYLLMTRSLLRDGDVVLDNDYGEHLYREFYPSDVLRRSLGLQEQRELDPHDVPGRRGERRPVHLLGLSLLLLPGYLLAGWAGAIGVAALLGSLAAWQAVRLALALCPGRSWGWFGGLAVALLSPLVAYAGSLHSEPAAAMCVTYLALLVAVPDEQRSAWWPGLALALLPWLHVKYLPVAFLLAGWLTVDGRRAGRSDAWWPLLGLLAGMATQAWSFASMYGSPLPNAPQVNAGGKFPSALSGWPWIGLPGLLFDQQDGLVSVWPVALLAVPGAVRLRRSRGARRLLVLVGVHLLLIATYRLWRAGHAPAGRQLLPVLGLLGPFIGAGAGWLWDRRPALVRGLVAVNAAMVAVYAWVPRLRYPAAADGLSRSPLADKLDLWWLDLLLPVTARGGIALLVAGAYLLALLGWAVWLARAGGLEDSALEGQRIER